MPIYEYETIPEKKNAKPRRYEIQQRMSEKPLTHHPETGEKLRRVYTGFAVGTSSSQSMGGLAPAPMGGGGSCCGTGGCGCGN